jgi:PAS domain S-box-containing protein
MVNSNLSETIFVGDSEMARLMRSHDWSQTPFGDIETWPQSLRSSLSICLNSRFPIAIYWGQDSILLYNDAWRPIVGDKHPWALGRAGREVWSEIWDDIGPELASVLATGEGTFHNDELLSMYRFGYTEECFFEYTFNPIQGEGGSIDGVFNIVTETTYRVLNDRRARLLREVASKTGTAKTAEEACVLMAKTLKSDPADIPFALLYLMDQDGSTVRLCGHTEVKVDHSIAPKVVDLTADDSGGWSIAQVAQTAQSQIIPNLVKRFGTLPGSPWSEPPQEAVVLPIAATGQGKMAGVLVAVASPRRRLDDTYLDFFNQIAQQIAMAIANVRSYEEERRRVEQLAELDRAKTVFFSNVSHEFRTPLTLMLSPLEEVLERVDEWESGGEMSTHPPIPPSTLKEQLQLVQRNGLRLQKLVNTLLDFSRIEAGRVEATYEPTDLAAFTAELTSVFRSAIERANLRLIVDCPPLPEAVYVDREMWEKIVLNLLSNAFKFTFEGEIAIGLQWANDRVDLIVRDTGIGIPAAELPHLFERFHRVKGVQGRSIEGSGIGLSLVQELVKLHQGTINVTSTEGAGTCFTLSIPTGTAHLLPDRIGAPRTLASTALGANSYLEEALRWLPEEANREWQRANGGNILPTPTPDSRLPTSPTPRILLADDNADMRDYVRRLLSQQYEVKAVADGSEALSAIRRQVPDLILTDVMMPNLDGFGLLQALRSDPETREVPIIMLSARAGEEARIEGLAAGADDYLTKPFSARELLARVEATLKLAQLRQEVGAALRESEAKYRLLFESIDQGFCIIEMVFNAANQPIDYRFLLTNPAFDKQTGTENAMGKTVREIAPQHEDYWFEIYGNVALTGESIRFENLAQEFHRWYEVYAFPIGEPEQRRVGILFNDITDRKRVEEARAATEQRYRIVSDLIPFGMWEADMQGSATYLSQLFLEMTGQTLEEHRQTWHTLLHPDDRQPTVAAWYECVQSGSLWEHEFRIRGKDGHYRTILARGLPVRNTAGEITSYVGANYDITDRKQAEEALRRSEERLRVSQELSLDAFTILDSVRDETGAIVDFVWTYVNPKAAEILQHPVEELVGQRLLDVLPGNQLNSELFDRYVRVVETGEPHDIELSYNADGITGWFRNMTVKLEDGIAIFFSDITERKQTEQALRVAEERLRVALQNAPIIVFNQDHELKYTWIYNPVLYELHEMLGKHDRDYLPPEDSEPLTAIKQRVLDTGIGAREEIKITRDGRNCYYDLTVEPLRDSNDTVIGITCAAIDISELKQTEINLRESEARFRGVVESNMVGIVFWDVSGCITDANEMAVQMLGYSREELQSGQIRWQDITSPEFQQIGAAMQAQLLAEGVCPPFETAYICKDGTQIPILIGGALLPGYSDRGVAYFLDITDRVQVERDR